MIDLYSNESNKNFMMCVGTIIGIFLLIVLLVLAAYHDNQIDNQTNYVKWVDKKHIDSPYMDEVEDSDARFVYGIKDGWVKWKSGPMEHYTIHYDKMEDFSKKYIQVFGVGE